ncbi:unnamed protein product, partial [Nesidiocoris tenuis]
MGTSARTSSKESHHLARSHEFLRQFVSGVAGSRKSGSNTANRRQATNPTDRSAPRSIIHERITADSPS